MIRNLLIRRLRIINYLEPAYIQTYSKGNEMQSGTPSAVD
jgi:hypothetical protein